MPAPKPQKPGRNDPCSCGSQKKFKICCGGPGPPEVPRIPQIISGMRGQTFPRNADQCRKDAPTLNNAAILLNMESEDLVMMNAKCSREDGDPAKVWFRAGVGYQTAAWPGGPMRVLTMIRGPDARTSEEAARALQDECEKKVAMKGEPAAEGPRWVLDPLSGTRADHVPSWARDASTSMT